MAVVLVNPGDNLGVAAAGSIAVVTVSASDGERLVSARGEHSLIRRWRRFVLSTGLCETRWSMF